MSHPHSAVRPDLASLDLRESSRGTARDRSVATRFSTALTSQRSLGLFKCQPYGPCDRNEDTERQFRRTLGAFYGGGAQVVYLPQSSLEIPSSLAIFDPLSPRQRGYQYFPNGETIFGLRLSSASLDAAQRMFASLWSRDDYEIVGERDLEK